MLYLILKKNLSKDYSNILQKYILIDRFESKKSF